MRRQQMPRPISFLLGDMLNMFSLTLVGKDQHYANPQEKILLKTICITKFYSDYV